MKRLLPVIGVLLIGYTGYLINDSSGYMTIPLPGPVDSRLNDTRYTSAAATAVKIITSARQNLKLPAMSVAVAIDGRLVWAAAVGWANAESRVPATVDTKFRIGSTSKAVTATLLARLIDDDVIQLDSPISTWSAGLTNPQWNKITPRQLMSHTAGLPGYDENRDWIGIWHTWVLQTQFDDVKQALEVFDGTELLYEPGTDFHYSSFDVVLMSAVLQDATGRSYLDLLSAELSEPLGLVSTHADYTDRDVVDRATFYERRQGEIKPWRQVNLSVKWAGGGLVSTPSELVQIASAWLDESYIRPKTVERLWTPQTLSTGEVNEQRYAIGWRSDTTMINGREMQRRHHGGVSKGSMNWLVIYPEVALAVDISINARTDEFSDFAAYEREISQLFLR